MTPTTTDARAVSTRATTMPRPGVQTVEHIRERCRIDAETGCWLWAYALNSCGSPMTTVRLVGDKPQSMLAGRAAWLLAGRSIPAEHVVYRRVCRNTLCVNPEHMATGTRKAARTWSAADGHERGMHRRAVAKAAALQTAVPAEVVRQIEALRADGLLVRDIVERLGVSRTTVGKVNAGRHPHSSASLRTVRGASVFSLGRAA